jgi:hypothetical protein
MTIFPNIHVGISVEKLREVGKDINTCIELK